MKKIFILIAILTTLPIKAACPIEDGATACSVAQFEVPKIAPTYSTKPMIKEFSGTPEARLKPTEKSTVKPKLQNFGAQPNDYSYNANCQFGVCQNNSGEPQLFNNREK